MNYLRVKNWHEFQHYTDRDPPWIKLHRRLLDDYEFGRLQDASKAHLMLIWLFAAQNDGRIPEDARFLQRKLSLDHQPDLEAFKNQGLLIVEHDASTAIAEGKQGGSEVIALARSREKRREEEINDRFAAFWSAYPRKVAKPNAMRAWRKVDGEHEAIMAGLMAALTSQQWHKEGGQYIPHPATFLTQRRWEDQFIAVQSVSGGFTV